MKSKNTLKNFLIVIGVSSAVFIITSTISPMIFKSPPWLGMLAGLITLLFMLEAVQPWNDGQITSNRYILRPSDKILLSICLAIQITVGLYFLESEPW